MNGIAFHFVASCYSNEAFNFCMHVLLCVSVVIVMSTALKGTVKIDTRVVLDICAIHVRDVLDTLH